MYGNETNLSPRRKTLLPRPRSYPTREPIHWPDPGEVSPWFKLQNEGNLVRNLPRYTDEHDTYFWAVIDHVCPPHVIAILGICAHGKL